MVSAIRLSPSDNLLFLTRSFDAGEAVKVGETSRTLATPIGLVHKTAACAISQVEKILKRGGPHRLGDGRHRAR